MIFISENCFKVVIKFSDFDDFRCRYSFTYILYMFIYISVYNTKINAFRCLFDGFSLQDLIYNTPKLRIFVLFVYIYGEYKIICSQIRFWCFLFIQNHRSEAIGRMGAKWYSALISIIFDVYEYRAANS